MTRARTSGIGSNLGDRLAHLQLAVDDLAAADGVTVVAVSPVYETAPVGGPEQDDYLNAVVAVATGAGVSAPANTAPSPPPNQRYPGWLNINRTQDVAVSLTKVMGRHTMKAGFYNNHSFKAQNVGAGGVPPAFQGYVDFGNDTNNALDTGFGYANAATGVFTQYLQASDFIEGQMVYDNTEFYVQDNWKVNNRMTLDYGVRFTRQQPQYDQFQQMSNFFPELWSAGAGADPVHRRAAATGRSPARATRSNAMDPRNGQILTAPGTPNTQAAIGTPIPGSGNPLNGIRQAGDGIAEDRLHLADAGRRTALRRRLRPDRQPDHGAARRRRALLRPSGRQHRLLDSRATRRSPRRGTSATASCRRSARG